MIRIAESSQQSPAAVATCYWWWQWLCLLPYPCRYYGDGLCSPVGWVGLVQTVILLTF